MARQARAERTRDRILAAAEACFARAGYDATGVAEICAQAGVTKGAFYHHFPAKGAVFLALLNHWLDRLDAQLEAARAGALTIPEGLLRMAAAARLVFQDASGRLPIFLEFWTQASQHPEFWHATIAPYRRYRDWFARLIQQGIDERSLRPVDPNTAAETLVALATGILLQGLLDAHSADWGQVMEDGMRLLLDGLKP